MKLGMTVADLAGRGAFGRHDVEDRERRHLPSLSTLQALSRALNVPVTTAFFCKFEEQRDAMFIKNGQGLVI